MKDQLYKNTRINVKFYLPALSTAICLQRKKWFGWVTVSWTYPSIHRVGTCESIKEYLFWRENHKEQNEAIIGKEIISKCSMNWDSDAEPTRTTTD